MANTSKKEKVSACNRVFCVNELLERILAPLERCDLLLGMRVNRAFGDIITSSSVIRHAIGFHQSSGEYQEFNTILAQRHCRLQSCCGQSHITILHSHMLPDASIFEYFTKDAATNVFSCPFLSIVDLGKTIKVDKASKGDEPGPEPARLLSDTCQSRISGKHTPGPSTPRELSARRLLGSTTKLMSTAALENGRPECRYKLQR